MLQVNSEFYTGWLDHWGDQHAVVHHRKVSLVLAEMLVMGANVNMCVVLDTHSTVMHDFCAIVVNPIVGPKQWSRNHSR